MRKSSAYYSEGGGRKNNEDSQVIVESGGTTLAIVADGLGGHANGEIASQATIKTITSALSQKEVSIYALKEAIEAANELLAHDKTYGGMKSTVAVLWMNSSGALAANVGDTRIYQFRDGKIEYQSRDHTLLQLEVISGEVDPRDVRKNPERNCLLRALGAKDEVKADIVEISVHRGDAFLLCSDGFWDNILEEEMLETLSDSSMASDWLKRMRRIAKTRMDENADNHTAIAIRLGEK